MEKLTIKNRKDQNVVVVIDKVDNQKGLAFVMHGLGGKKDQSHIQTFKKSFLDAKYTTVTFDTTNTFGESDGNYEDATTTNYYEDLEDVINWAKSQEWYQEPFCLAGHSLGGICTAYYAEQHPENVKALAPISTVVSGELSVEAQGKESVDKWKEEGWQEYRSRANPDILKRLKWGHMEDRLTWDLIPESNKLTMPVLLIVGSEDDRTLPKHQQILFDALPGEKEIHIIKGAPHTFQDQNHLNEIKEIFDKWLKKIEEKND